MQQTFPRWLLTNPTSSQLCKHLATDFLDPFDIDDVRISWIAENDDLEIIGEYGFLDPIEGDTPAIHARRLGEIFPSKEWRSYKSTLAKAAKAAGKPFFAIDGETIQLPLGAFGINVGFITVAARTNPMSDEAKLELFNLMEQYTATLTLYLTMTRLIIDHERQILAMETNRRVAEASSEARFESLSHRQRGILDEMLMGEINKNIASHVGFSEATVRSEITEIYRILDAHSRKEAVDSWRAYTT
tara:strand:+ start:1099 stop:1833 length:735 start_codon:yes stop_codon:yes gene_type:complete